MEYYRLFYRKDNMADTLEARQEVLRTIVSDYGLPIPTMMVAPGVKITPEDSVDYLVHQLCLNLHSARIVGSVSSPEPTQLEVVSVD